MMINLRDLKDEKFLSEVSGELNLEVVSSARVVSYYYDTAA